LKRKIILVGGARPNFMKIAPLVRAIKAYNRNSQKGIIHYRIIHTRQHYDYEMSRIFFNDLEIPEPDSYLGVGSSSHGEQTGRIIIEFEKILFREKPDLVIVVGDVNSTIACALTAVKMQIPVAHVEAGLRSYDRTMPEEINRLLTDVISNYLFTPSLDANENLRGEGIPEEKIFFVGNVMIDSLLFNLDKAKKSNILKELGLQKKSSNVKSQFITDYAMLTLHRPNNVDIRKSLYNILIALKRISKKIPIIFPMHPRTRKQIKIFGFQDYFYNFNNSNYRLSNISSGLHCISPLGYLHFVKLMMHAKFIMTDSGGIQEETTALNIPCLTLRDTTERPITINQGTNVLVGNDPDKIVNKAFSILENGISRKKIPKYWDGKTAERIIKVLTAKL